MQRRTFFRRLFGALGVAVAGPRIAPGRAPVPIQESPIAGFQYHRGEAVWPALRVGSPVSLAREPGNPHDPKAVAVYFHDEQLGYVPRAENAAIAQMLDRGQTLEAKISQLADGAAPWERVKIAVLAV